MSVCVVLHGAADVGGDDVPGQGVLAGVQLGAAAWRTRGPRWSSGPMSRSASTAPVPWGAAASSYGTRPSSPGAPRTAFPRRAAREGALPEMMTPSSIWYAP